jgi:hypothetical protein
VKFLGLGLLVDGLALPELGHDLFHQHRIPLLHFVV